MGTEAAVLGQPWPFSNGSAGLVPAPSRGMARGRGGAPQFTTVASVPSPLETRPEPRPPWEPRGPLAVLRAPLAAASQVGAPGPWGCGSLSLRTGDQDFLEYSFLGRNHPVEFSKRLACVSPSRQS